MQQLVPLGKSSYKPETVLKKTHCELLLLLHVGCICHLDTGRIKIKQNEIK